MKFAFAHLTVLFISVSFPSFAQSPRQIHIKKAKDKIILDGILNEMDWNISEIADNFKLVRPFDSAFAQSQSVVKLTFDEKFIYIGAIIYQAKSQYTVSSLKRDFDGGSSDVFTVNIDTFKDKLNGMQFAVSPLNVQREGLIALGDQGDNSWDNKWYSKVKNYDDYWVVEMAIPFTTLRYKVKPLENSWNINFGRNFMKGNEISTWNPVPRNFRPSNLAFSGLLVWDDAPPSPGTNVSLIPFLSTNYSKDYPRNGNLEVLDSPESTKVGVGMDAKVAVTPSLNLDLTFNPDFSQVEVDQQQTNLSRFELFFPEKRQFFIENADLFGTFGFPETRPFFSRRIGITQNPITGLAQQVPILAGARLSGKLDDNWRIGLMNMQTRKANYGDDNFLPATNYTVATLQRKVFDRSSLSGVFVNKENFLNDVPNDVASKNNKFNRVAGIEYNYYSPNNRFETESYIHKSFSPNISGNGLSVAHYMGYSHPNLEIKIGGLRVDSSYVAETGYVPRSGIYQLFRPLKVILNPKNPEVAKYINSYGFGTEGKDVFNLAGKRLDSETSLFLFFRSPAGTEINFGSFWSFTNLFKSFDPTNAKNNPDPDFFKNVVKLPIGNYSYRTQFVSFESARRNKLFGKFLWYGGDFFNGKTSVIQASINYRLQPVGLLAMDFNYTDIKLPKPYNSVQYLLVGPKAELSFSRSVFFSTFFQYNTQTNNSNINSRLQWRYSPVSDVFLVFTDNYFAEGIPRYNVNTWAPKNRALILKITYWLNV